MRLAWAALAAVCILGSASCSSGAKEVEAKTSAARLELPQQIVGLTVGAEKIGAGLEKVVRPYVDTVAVFSLREDDLLRASLQVNRFNRAARPEDSEFRESIIATIGGTAPIKLRVNEDRVYATASSDQAVFTWFRGEGMYVLAVQKDFQFPRTLLRRFIDLELSV